MRHNDPSEHPSSGALGLAGADPKLTGVRDGRAVEREPAYKSSSTRRAQAARATS